jgi:ABC-2 type transport system permease protein
MVDEDHSELSRRITHAFLPPYFQAPAPISERDIVPLMNRGKYTFVVDIPPNFERDVLGRRRPAIQVDVDATAMVQAGLGSGYVQQIVAGEIADFLSRSEGAPMSRVNLDVRIEFNPNITTAWFTCVMAIINNVTMLAIILAGAALIREREHGTKDHLLVMPVTPFEIAMSKVWANGLVITVAVGLSLYGVVRMFLGIPIAGSIPLFMAGVMIYLFFATAIGIFLGTVARSMPQLGLLYMLVYMPMNMLSGSNTPLESMPPWLATIMEASPSTHFVSFAQSILYRGAGIEVVWQQFLAVAPIGGLFFGLAIMRFRSVVLRCGLARFPTANPKSAGRCESGDNKFGIRWVQRWREEGSSEAKPRGGSHSVLEDYAERILALVAEHPDWTLNEMLAKMHKQRIPGSRTGAADVRFLSYENSGHNRARRIGRTAHHDS